MMTTTTASVLFDPALVRSDAARLWFDPMLGGVEATVCRFVHHRFAPHAHEKLMIGLIERGTKVFARGGAEHVVGVGGLSIVNPGEAHTGARAGGDELRYRALYVDPGVFDAARPVEVGAATLDDKDVFQALLAASGAIIGRAPVLQREEQLVEALALLTHRHARPMRAAKVAPLQLARARELLADRCAEDMPVEAVARAVDLSPFHLMRAFRRQFGLPMHAFQLGARIERSKAMLRASADTVAEIALACGFADQSHFTRRFKAHVGLAPAAYRRAFQDWRPEWSA